MPVEAINFREKLEKISALWSPRIIAQMNENHLKLVKVQGEFVWHSHPETDEVFIVLQGTLHIQLRGAEVVLGPGEMCVVPRGVEHCPMAPQECHLLLVEPAGTVNTGDAGGRRTASADAWI
jgi:mannose-6-phosphate isomerase-like protein (cupin superfamily)